MTNWSKVAGWADEALDWYDDGNFHKAVTNHQFRYAMTVLKHEESTMDERREAIARIKKWVLKESVGEERELQHGEYSLVVWRNITRILTVDFESKE